MRRLCLSAVHPLCADVRFSFCAGSNQTRVTLPAAARCRLAPGRPCWVFSSRPSARCRFKAIPVFCLSIAGYNWLGGGAASAVILCALRSDRRSSLYRQRRLVAVSILLPLWVWLVAAFPDHALGISNT